MERENRETQRKQPEWTYLQSCKYNYFPESLRILLFYNLTDSEFCGQYRLKAKVRLCSGWIRAPPFFSSPGFLVSEAESDTYMHSSCSRETDWGSEWVIKKISHAVACVCLWKMQ